MSFAQVGSWCWPVLVLGILGVASSSALNGFAHSITFGFTLAVFTNLCQFVSHFTTPPDQRSMLRSSSVLEEKEKMWSPTSGSGVRSTWSSWPQSLSWWICFDTYWWMLRAGNSRIVSLASCSSCWSSLFPPDITGKEYKFHFGSCVYNVPTVAQGQEGECPDAGVGPVEVTTSNALGVYMPMWVVSTVSFILSLLAQVQRGRLTLLLRHFLYLRVDVLGLFPPFFLDMLVHGFTKEISQAMS